MSCAHGICGSDGMTINGVSALACQKLVKDYEEDKQILIEPLSVFPVVKDLVVDIEGFFAPEKSIHPPRQKPHRVGARQRARAVGNARLGLTTT